MDRDLVRHRIRCLAGDVGQQKEDDGMTTLSSIKPFVSLNFRVPVSRNPIFLLALALFCAFALFVPHFFSVFNVSNILLQSAFVGLLAIGLTPLMIGAGIDLSVGATLGLAACIVVGLQDYGLSIAVPAALASGVLVGMLNGWVVTFLGVDAFIATLASMIGIRGVTFELVGDVSMGASSSMLVTLGAAKVGPVSVIVVATIVVALIIHYVMRRTIHGRYTYAIGGNRKAAEDAGLPISSHIMLNFVVSGLCAAFCGIAMAANLAAATPSFGRDYELWAITAVVLGGTSLRGGTGTVTGTIAAVLTLSILRNGLNLMHVPMFYVPIAMGVVLVLALLADKKLNKRTVT
jgi:ribose transport system permease protein